MTLSPTDLLTELTAFSEASAVSGDEREVRKLILQRLKDLPRIESLTTDTLGNLSGILKGDGSADAPRGLLTAHMDEAGLMVQDVADDGLISVAPVGRVDGRILAAQRVQIGAEKTPGVSLWRPIHRHGDMHLPGVDDLSIDTGGSNSFSPGDRIAFAGSCGLLRENAPYVVGKALDRSAACIALIETLKTFHESPLPYDLAFAFTAQHHVGVRGAMILTRRLQPAWSITLGGVTADDLPPVERDTVSYVPNIRLGGGVVVRVKDLLYVPSPDILNAIRKAAADSEQSLQTHALAERGDRSDASALSSYDAGAASATLSVPLRYMGTTRELLHVDDLNRLMALLTRALPTFTLTA
jgi:endoglucanase